MPGKVGTGFPSGIATKRTNYDAVIVGGGHNGLVCAAYLAMAGLKVTVLERRGIVGGAAVIATAIGFVTARLLRERTAE